MVDAERVLLTRLAGRQQFRFPFQHAAQVGHVAGAAGDVAIEEVSHIGDGVEQDDDPGQRARRPRTKQEPRQQADTQPAHQRQVVAGAERR